MAIHRLNHAVLYVRDAERSATFFTELLGFRRLDGESEQGAGIPGAAFLRAEASTNDHDLALFSIGDAAADSPAGRSSVGLYHLAWEVPTLTDLAEAKERLAELGALVGENNHGVSRSLYCQDPDGIEFEVMWEVPADLLAPDEPSNVPLDLDADVARFGAARRGRGA